MMDDPNSSASIPPSKFTVGCIGGGQLGRMMAMESPRLNLSMKFLDPGGKSCPAAQAAGCDTVVMGGLKDPASLRELSLNCDVVTVEIEHVCVETLSTLEAEGVNVQPSARVIGIIQDKLVQKEHFAKCGIPLPPYRKVTNVATLELAARDLGLPLMLKSRRGGYDGRGNAVLRDTLPSSVNEAMTSLGVSDVSEDLDLIAEGWIDFLSEIGVMVVRAAGTGETRAYPAVSAIQVDSICRAVLVPARDVSAGIRKKCEEIASQAVSSLGKGASGVFGVELFHTSTGQVLLNEVAPRPHNTGHYTQDACVVSQFENHLRGICGLALGETSMIVEAAAMVNVLGTPDGDIHTTMKIMNTALTIPRASLHWYGKAYRPGRKMGHINLTANSPAEMEAPLQQLLSLENIASVLQDKHRNSSYTKTPLVGIIMGSTSDLPTMQAAVQILTKFNIPHEVDVVSAHRTPLKLMEYGTSAASRGLQVIIAGAGGAAHLPGMMAAVTPLPVIGVPIKTSTLNGQDSLLSIVQMPRGIPVATVAIGNATNAGLLAVRILAASRAHLRVDMENYQEEMKNMVEGTSEELMKLGSEEYLEGMSNKSTSVNV